MVAQGSACSKAHARVGVNVCRWRCRAARAARRMLGLGLVCVGGCRGAQRMLGLG